MRIQHNITAMNAYRNYNTNSSSLGKNLEKLSSGYKINRAGDDAAGLAISEKMRAQITGLDVAQKNAKDGISVVQTAEGALTEVHDMLNRLYELAEQSANGTYGETEREKLQSEVSQLQTEITRISEATNFNGKKLLDGSMTDTKTLSADFNATIRADSSDATKTTGTTAEHQYIAAIDLTHITKANANDVSFGGADKYVDVQMRYLTSIHTIQLRVGGVDYYSAEEITEDLEAGSTMKLEGAVTTMVGSDSVADTSSITITLNKDLKYTEDINDGDWMIVGATFNARALGQETGDKALNLQIGDTAATYNHMDVDILSMSAEALGVGGLDISTYEGSVQAMWATLTAIDRVSTQRASLGAIQNRLDHTINNLSTMQENIQDAESTIRDTDVAQEMMEYTKNSILVQSAQSMLAQANQLPQSVLSLLQ